MNQLFKEFSKPTYTDWVNQLTKDLKGQSDALIKRVDAIEELNFDSYQHQDSTNTTPSEALLNPYVSQTYKETNAWQNLATILVEQDSTANKKALDLLNLGATALRFELGTAACNWNELTKDIQLEFIETTVKINTLAQFESIQAQLSDKTKSQVFYEYDFIANPTIDFDLVATHLKNNQTNFFVANGFGIQQTGATTWQEIAYTLASAHEIIVQLMDRGFSIDEAAACVHFNVGVGSNYFYEIAKIRVLRILWSKIIGEYKADHACTYNTRITGIVGFTNKSLKDPYTNLLRQTTEAMSLAFAGVHAICVLPYDQASEKGATSLSTRMAVNIPLILQEESYLDKVIDPLSGSYTVEYLTNEIADKAWNLFQTIESKGGISNENALNFLKEAVSNKAQLRKDRVVEKVDALIGINIFPNFVVEENNWVALKSYLDMPQLILEQSI